jgi:hypothetical protein
VLARPRGLLIGTPAEHAGRTAPAS